jgi:hypothetical protein
MPRLRAFLTKEKCREQSSSPDLLNPIVEAESETVLLTLWCEEWFLYPPERAIVMS